MADVGVVVVNFNRADLLVQCLQSLREARDATALSVDLVVVDNGSADGSVETVRERYPDVRLIANAANEGFAGGVSRGLAALDAPWVLLVNNDATVAPDAIDRLMEAARSAPDLAAVAAQMRFVRRPDLVNSAGLVVDRLGVAQDRLLGEPVDGEAQVPCEVFGACGGAALLRTDAVAAVGGFDPRFFAYLEDVDLAWRLAMAGWRSLYCPAAVVWHHHSATSGHGSAFKYRLVGRNRVRMLARNMTTRHLLRHGAAIVAYDVAYVAYAAVKDRTLAPVRGRLAGLREWRAYRREGRTARRPVELARTGGTRAALRRRGAWQVGATAERGA